MKSLDLDRNSFEKVVEHIWFLFLDWAVAGGVGKGIFEWTARRSWNGRFDVLDDVFYLSY